MAYTWKTTASGDWSNAANWNGSAPPSGNNGGYNDVNIAAASGTVTIAQGETYGGFDNINLGATSAVTLSVAGTLGAQDTNVDTGSEFIVANHGAVTFGGISTIAGTFDIQAGGSLTSNSSITFSGGTMDIEGTLTGSGGSYIATTGTGTMNFDGANTTLLSGGGSITYNVSNGSSIAFNANPAAGSSINFGATGGGTNNVTIPAYNTYTLPITGFGPGDQITFTNSGTFNSVTYSPNTGAGAGTYNVVFKDNGSTVTTLSDVKFATGVTPPTGTVMVTGGDVYTFSDVCFLEGTAIATPAGEVAVEALQIGDLVTTIVAGEAVAKPVKWVGYRSVKPGDLASEDAHPIRIKAGAFADNVPHRDLLVTPEHCILADGGLTPARLLVNGRSIIVDTGISAFTYYHVELENHGILLAEGLATESYLDTGNRGRFANSKVTAFRFRLDQDSANDAWQHAAAPLTVDPASVEPIWRMLDARAAELGFTKVTAEPVLTTDPDLHIVTGNGAVIRPMRQNQDKFLFLVPAGAADLTIASRTARPSETVGPFIDDRRDLGVLVGAIALYEGRKKTAINGHLTDSDLTGWFGLEGSGQRWTNGSAKLPLDLTKLRGQAAILEIQIVNAGPYQVAAETAADVRAA